MAWAARKSVVAGVAAVTVLAAKAFLPMDVRCQTLRRHKQVPRLGVPNIFGAVALNAHILGRRFVLSASDEPGRERNAAHRSGDGQQAEGSDSSTRHEIRYFFFFSSGGV